MAELDALQSSLDGNKLNINRMAKNNLKSSVKNMKRNEMAFSWPES